MLQISFIRENITLVKENLKRRGKSNLLPLVDELINIDSVWRKNKQKLDDLRRRRNTISLDINKSKKEGKDIKHFLQEAKQLPEIINKLEQDNNGLVKRIEEIQIKIPNILSKSVPAKDKVIFKFGTIKKNKVLGHAEIAEKLGVVDFDSSAKTSGHGFFYLKGDLARLNLALVSFAIDFLVKKKYTYVEPPLMIRKKVCDSVIDMAFFKEHVYKIEGEDLYMIGTSEHPLVGMFIDKTVREKDLPIRLAGYSQCFRKELGSHTIDERGLYRTHQFNKVEQVIVCSPKESDKMYKELLDNSIAMFKKLKLPFRVIEFGAADVGDWKSRTADVEVWSPRRNDYFEVGSCSNLTEFQARKLNLRVQGGGEIYTPHTLNNTAIATSRVMVAILENNQTKKGTVKIPAVLQKYMGGVREIKLAKTK